MDQQVKNSVQVLYAQPPTSEYWVAFCVGGRDRLRWLGAMLGMVQECNVRKHIRYAIGVFPSLSEVVDEFKEKPDNCSLFWEL